MHNNPYEVYQHPEKYKAFLTANDDKDFEGQLFDRKEAGRYHNGRLTLDSFQKHQIETVSAFSNSNREGGLLVVGISQTGEVIGIGHLSDDERITLTKYVQDKLVNAIIDDRFYWMEDSHGIEQEICLIYVHYSRNICQTKDADAKAWIRSGVHNKRCDDDDRERLRREKKIINYEMTICCPYDPEELDKDVLEEFRQGFYADAEYDWSDEEILFKAGAIVKENNKWCFTNAGYLFFATYPQRLMASSYIRLMRFGVDSDTSNRGTDTLDKSFRGSIVKQIRDIRAYIKSSGLFRTFRRPRADGGFIEEEELPFSAVDEAIVNAVTHREYAMNDSIRCELYENALVVQNMGRILQPSRNIPDNFSLGDVALNPYRRNEKIVEWLRCFRDEKGAEFVKSYGEGTQRMLDAMQELGLPAPAYAQLPTQTRVTLYSNAHERAMLTRRASNTEYTNLYRLYFAMDESGSSIELPDIQFKDILATLADNLKANNWYIDNLKFSSLVVHKQGVEIQLPDNVREYVRFYPAYVFQIKRFYDKLYLCIDYKLEVRSVLRLNSLLKILKPQDFIGISGVGTWQGWRECRINNIQGNHARVYFYDYNQEETIPIDQIIPSLPIHQIKLLLKKAHVKFDLSKAIKSASLSIDPNSSRKRDERTRNVASEVAANVFPIQVQRIVINMENEPASLRRYSPINQAFSTYTLPEPKVEFSRQNETSDITTGITTFGSYDTAPKDIEIVPICDQRYEHDMLNLIERLRAGKYKYKGAERTFHARFSYNKVITFSSPNAIWETCKNVLNTHPEWIGNRDIDRIFLVHTPATLFASDDENSPYYTVKRLLLENGIPCQMIDTNTIRNPDWKDLNLALSITAKCGITPWVLPERMPDVDAFVGLSYTGGRRDAKRQMGYANVFNEYGRWQFYAGNTETFPYDQRPKYLGILAEDTLSKLAQRGLSETPHIHFQYSDRFSRADREAITEAARKVRPLGTFSFVWIADNHNVRLFDSRAETDGSLSRGSFVVANDYRIYLSTTGYNPYRKMLGTPVMLQIDIRTTYPDGYPENPPDLKNLATQVLSLTKLNWASTSSLSAIPITTKYASRIAYLTAAILRQGGDFKLHSALEKVPWFL